MQKKIYCKGCMSSGNHISNLALSTLGFAFLTSYF